LLSTIFDLPVSTLVDDWYFNKMKSFTLSPGGRHCIGWRRTVKLLVFSHELVCFYGNTR